MPLSTKVSPLLFGSLVLATASVAPCGAAEYGRARFLENATRCSAYGPEFAAVEGSDTCMRIGGHVRVQLGSNAGLRSGNDWGAGHASSATLQSDGSDLRPNTPSHLRIQGGLEYPNPFR